MSTHSQSFAELFEKSFAQNKGVPGDLVEAKVLYVDHDRVIVDTGLKSEGVIARAEFGEESVSVGDHIKVYIESIEDGFGHTNVSREKAKRSEAWAALEEAHNSRQNVKGLVVERVKGGFTVDVLSVRAFLPGSLVDVRPVRDSERLEGKELDFKIIKMDQRRNNIVVSRRAVIEEEGGSERKKVLESLEEGQEITGVVKNITDYGAFIDLGGVDGLLHITDIAWKRVKHPAEVLTVGNEIRVKVLKFDRDKQRVSLGLKQLEGDPWQDIERRYPVGTRLFGVITNITDYGCFVEVESGIEGLVHMSEMDWTNKNIHPAKVVQLGEEVEVMVLEVNEERRRISLGMKQCKRNPWKEFSDNHEKGQKVSGKIKSITDFGVFIGLDGGIDGLVHVSDLSWKESGENAVRNYKKGDEMEAVILAIDPERERISLGVKQLSSDPTADFLESHPKGSRVKVTITEVQPKVLMVKLADEMAGQIKSQDMEKDQADNLEQQFKVGDEIEAIIIGADRKASMLNLSLKSSEDKPKASKKPKPEEVTNTKLGDLLREQMEDKEGK